MLLKYSCQILTVQIGTGLVLKLRLNSVKLPGLKSSVAGSEQLVPNSAQKTEARCIRQTLPVLEIYVDLVITQRFLQSKC